MGEAPSEFHVEVVRIGEVIKHPNADTLSITNVHGGYPCIFRTGDFKEGDLAVYVPVDALVPVSRLEFAFLAKPGVERHRVRAMKLRGVFSMGLLVSVPGNMRLNEDVAEFFHITKYEPPVKGDPLTPPGNKAPRPQRSPPGMPVYGVEAYRRHKYVLQDGEPVVITEKLHGTNARYSYIGGKLYVGSHNRMRGNTPSPLSVFFNRLKLRVKTLFGIPHRAQLEMNEGDVWWQMAKQLNLKERLAKIPDHTIYGEIIGAGVQKGFDYGYQLTRQFVLFDVFDIHTGKFLSYDALQAFAKAHGFMTAPLLYMGPWTESCLNLAEGKTIMGGKHIREGIVVKADPERTLPGFGRVSLKYVSEAYLLEQGK